MYDDGLGGGGDAGNFVGVDITEGGRHVYAYGHVTNGALAQKEENCPRGQKDANTVQYLLRTR